MREPKAAPALEQAKSQDDGMGKRASFTTPETLRSPRALRAFRATAKPIAAGVDEHRFLSSKKPEPKMLAVRALASAPVLCVSLCM
jgi:hypothetical protein